MRMSIDEAYMILKVILIVVDAICVVSSDSKIVKTLGVLAIFLISTSFFWR